MSDSGSEQVLLPHRHRSLQDVPRSPADHDRVLRRVVASALAAQGPGGSLELDPQREDVGDTSLGVTSLIALACRREVFAGNGERQEACRAAARSLEFFLRHRVFRRDNPGYPFYRIRDSGLPYARYMVADGRHPFGDWPSTVWALLSAVNVLRLGPGVLPEAGLAELLGVAEGYWTWLTEATFFNSQDTANQALGAVVGGLMLAEQVHAAGRPDRAVELRADALDRYEALRRQWIPDRGAAIPREHGGGWDGNYGPISLSFLAQAHRVTGDPRFAAAGDELARYLDARLSANGFDLGGPRYSEQHAGFEAVLGLRYFGARIGADLGRYRGDDRFRYLMDLEGAGDGSAPPDGHFAFMTVWTIEDGTAWTPGPIERNRRFDLRRGQVSVAFDEDLAPALIELGGTVVLPAIVARQHGIGPLYRDGPRVHLLTRPLGPVRSREASGDGVSAKLVHTAVTTHAEVLLTVRSLYLTDGRSLHLVVLLDAGALPPGAEPALLTGLPYSAPADEPGRCAKIVGVTAQGGQLRFGASGATLIASAVTAGGLTVRGNGEVRVFSPQVPPGAEDLVFSSPVNVGLGQEQAAFAASPDPRGYGNPDAAWSRMLATELVEVLDGALLAGDVPMTGDRASGRWHVLAASWAPADAPDPGPVLVRQVDDGVQVSAPGLGPGGEQFRVLVGPPEGDARGEPVLRLLGAAGTVRA